MGAAGGERGKEKIESVGLKKIFLLKKKSFKKSNVNHNVWAEEERGDVNPSPGAWGRRASSKRPQISAILLRPPKAPTYSPEKSGLCDLLTLPGAGKTAETPSPLAL